MHFLYRVCQCFWPRLLSMGLSQWWEILVCSISQISSQLLWAISLVSFVMMKIQTFSVVLEHSLYSLVFGTLLPTKINDQTLYFPKENDLIVQYFIFDHWLKINNFICLFILLYISLFSIFFPFPFIKCK